jgi:hypothetical protein
MPVKLVSEGETKFHEESLKKFLSGDFGKVYRKEILDCILSVMKKSDATSSELVSHFFEKPMEYEDGDVEIIVTLKLKKIGEE